MRLKARIDGSCDRCSTAYLDRALTVVVTEHSLVSQNGDPGIKEEHQFTRTLCPSCYAEVYRVLEKETY